MIRLNTLSVFDLLPIFAVHKASERCQLSLLHSANCSWMVIWLVLIIKKFRADSETEDNARILLRRLQI